VVCQECLDHLVDPGACFGLALEVLRDQGVVPFLGDPPREELLGRTKAVHSKPGDGVSALDNHPDGSVLPTGSGPTDGLMNVSTPPPGDPLGHIRVRLVPCAGLAALEARAIIGRVGLRRGIRRAAEAPHLYQGAGLLYGWAVAILDEDGLCTLEVVDGAMVAAPPAHVEAFVLGIAVGRSEVLSSEHGDGSCSVFEDLAPHGVADLVRLAERVGELGDVNGLVDSKLMVDEVGEGAPERGQVGRGIEEEHGPCPERSDDLESGAVGEQDSPTLPWLQP